MKAVNNHCRKKQNSRIANAGIMYFFRNVATFISCMIHQRKYSICWIYWSLSSYLNKWNLFSTQNMQLCDFAKGVEACFCFKYISLWVCPNINPKLVVRWKTSRCLLLRQSLMASFMTATNDLHTFTASNLYYKTQKPISKAPMTSYHPFPKVFF